MHYPSIHDSEKSQAIHSSVTVLGLLRKKKDERNALVAISGTLIYNVIPIKLKVAVSMDAPVQHV